MNAVEIEEAVSALVAEPFNGEDFPYQFLAAFGFKETALKKLKSEAASTTDVPGAVLRRGNIHLIVAPPGQTSARLAALKASVKTAKGKCKFVLATDGEMVEAEELATGELLACRYTEIPNHFGFFLPLAGISTVAEIKDNPIDIRATGRLNKLYVQLLKDNEDWGSDAKRPALNQFMSRLIFCFFAEDTGIFTSEGLFTACLRQMSDETNTHDVIKELFRAMNTHPDQRKAANIRPYADAFPYVNGGLFSNEIDCPRFSKIARSYLLRIGELNWKEINPDIFGSMIQAVADDDERGSLGMHYTSVPNILKVLDPLFLDDLREQLEEAADNPRKLLNLRKRIAAIRVFDPACGSGNFLVIAYIKLREIEAEIIRRRKDDDRRSWIKLTNFYGIEIKSFPAEIARLALLIAEFQCNVRFIGQREACLDVLPLHDTGRIVNGNALRLDWTKVCPPTKPEGAIEIDLAGATGRLALDDLSSGDTFICGNPPYLGSQWRTEAQQRDMDLVFSSLTKSYKDLDYVAAWYLKAADYCAATPSSFALVATKTICQGIQVAMLWPLIFRHGLEIVFAHRPFTWGNLARSKAGVTCVIVGLARTSRRRKLIFDDTIAHEASNIGPYLIDMPSIIVQKSPVAISGLPTMDYGNKPSDGGHLILEENDKVTLVDGYPEARTYIRRYVGSQEFVRSSFRYCLWIEDDQLAAAQQIEPIRNRLEEVQRLRTLSKGKQSNDNANRPHRFVYAPHQDGLALIVPRVTSENRPYLPVGFADNRTIIADTAAAAYNAKLWMLSIVASRLHQQWIATVCVRLRTDYRYSNTLGWNTFPVPPLTENDKAALTRCAEYILLAREAHFPATIADLYDPEKMPADLRAAHDRNDETLERIYIGRRFKNDTERLEKLFDMYTKMIKDEGAKGTKCGTKAGRKAKQADGEADAP
jgi:hypothetical protein